MKGGAPRTGSRGWGSPTVGTLQALKKAALPFLRLLERSLLKLGVGRPSQMEPRGCLGMQLQ
eukprot:140046-Alexandrium_andersonii.AAC.1